MGKNLESCKGCIHFDRKELESPCINCKRNHLGGLYPDLWSLTKKEDPEVIHKADTGKAPVSLVPTGIIWAIARVRDYGLKKYPKTGREGWKNIDKNRIRDAFLRHVLRYIDDPEGVDEESGLPHRAHAACNLAFLCELEGDKNG